ncbi:tubulin-like doman-containing protein [Acrocarpospora sp. B8E8]|uniref:tubulin-like doman-containing protein n=1 Tax=Acrocarpospora sp. B8E8 TaxID=3153572 RepID=UPI00325DFE8C
MRIYQPMLFVGLGGTGCLIGAELERRLRDELCGPDGRELLDRMPGQNFLPYQLPSCMQFVYADLNEAELLRLKTRAVPGSDHVAAGMRTRNLVPDLVPRFDTYPEVARSLRTNIQPLVTDWLPPSSGEPRVAPLVRGAGQLPTVGRAALFETLRHGVRPAMLPVANAVGGISTSGGELAQLGGRLSSSCDVFIAFSVAGGTGSGIFYDYLHLVGHALEQAGLRAQIYPLVLLPSAFDEGLGGGRRATLNAGRALLDLFRLVDDQNGHAAGTELSNVGITGDLFVRYPVEGEIRLRASTVQTAFLFGRTSGVDREDLHRSIVSLVMSLVGTDIDQGEEEGARVFDRVYQSFADDFINRGVERETIAVSGIGNRGVSTSLVASMTVPVDDLADLVASRILARAVAELAAPPPGRAENNRDAVERMFGATNLDPLRTRAPLTFTELQATDGANAIYRMLATRMRGMEDNLKALEASLRTVVPQMVQDFDPRRGVEQMLGDYDPLRLRRILNGHPNLIEEVDKLGFRGLLELRRSEPPAPAGLATQPSLPQLRDRLLGVRKARWGDPVVQRVIQEQDAWYHWRARAIWHSAWGDQTARWEHKLSRTNRDLTDLTDELIGHAQEDDARFARRARDLYRARVGVTYLLPPRGEDLESFYEQVRNRAISHYVGRGRLRPNAGEADLLNEIIDTDGWRRVFQISTEDGPAYAKAHLRDRLKQEVKRLFRHREHGERPLLPPMADLVAQAAGKDGALVEEEDLLQFRQKLAALVPSGFSPQGTGEMKVLISYPAAARDAGVENYLRGTINLPKHGPAPEFRSLDADAIVVVQFRTSMGVTEVPELREVLHFWGQALRNEQDQDFLRWRQRLGYDFGYLMTTHEHRVRILQRFLIAMWNGQVQIEDGGPDSPERIRIALDQGADAMAMTLALTTYAGASSWGSLVRAYEEWTLSDDESIRRDFAARLMRLLPIGLEATPIPPDPMFEHFIRVAEEQLKLLEIRMPTLSEAGRRQAERLAELWGGTLRDALRLPFTGVSNPVHNNLEDLAEVVNRWL